MSVLNKSRKKYKEKLAKTTPVVKGFKVLLFSLSERGGRGPRRREAQKRLRSALRAGSCRPRRPEEQRRIRSDSAFALRVLRPRPAPRGDSRGRRRQGEAAARLPTGHARPDHPEPGGGGVRGTWGWSSMSGVQPGVCVVRSRWEDPRITGWRYSWRKCGAPPKRGSPWHTLSPLPPRSLALTPGRRPCGSAASRLQTSQPLPCRKLC
ncbi:PREDICTED: uncharacterized protein LOC102012646 [Chinchilla lanigera]|uniref:uncharacterized protein LOC102012646 n=1 Tax=Chinchilla lanigera TaxID=34839 RepID=UPI00038EB46B|nr:PREDICTED: uncharacterized protein LOC102012646 [Chinchilla lanigera]